MIEKNKKTVLLLVEDEKILVDNLEAKLIAEGIEVVKAYDGVEGLKLALEKHPDLILLDILLPKMDGVSLLKKLREDPWGSDAPVIILTNLDNPGVIADAISVDSRNLLEYMLKTDWSLADMISKVKHRLEKNN